MGREHPFTGIGSGHSGHLLEQRPQTAKEPKLKKKGPAVAGPFRCYPTDFILARQTLFLAITTSPTRLTLRRCGNAVDTQVSAFILFFLVEAQAE